MNIEIKPRNKIQEFLNNFHSKSEDLLFFLIQKLPDRLIPSLLMNWLEKYLDKRSKELQQEILYRKWEQAYLEKAVGEIQSIRQMKEAQTED